MRWRFFLALMVIGCGALAVFAQRERSDAFVYAPGSILEASEQAPITAIDFWSPPPRDVLDVVSERPLFSATRRPPPPPPPPPAPDLQPAPVQVVQPEPPPPPPAPPPPPPSISATLTGLVRSGPDTVALVRVEGAGDVVRLRTGDTYDGWTLGQDESGDLYLTQAGVQVPLTLSFREETATSE